MGKRTRILTLSSVLLAASAAAQAVAGAEEAPRPRLALALSGGGARGIAHIGALRALEEAGMPLDAIAANSMGAIVGGMYATGKSPSRIEAIVRAVDWTLLFTRRPDRRTLPVGRRVDRYAPTAGVSFGWRKVRLPAGLVGDHGVNRFLIQNLAPAGYAAGGDFDRLPVPFRAVAADLATGDLVVLARGDLARAVRASMSIPVVFDPIDWEGKKLVDALIVDNLPVDVARSFGAAVVVAIDVASPRLTPQDYESALGVASQVSEVLISRRHQGAGAEPDVLVRPDLGNHSTTDYSDIDGLIEAGYQATRASLPAIRAKLEAAGHSDPAPRPRAETGPPLEGTRIASVRVEGNTRVSEGLVRRAFNIPVGPGYVMARGLRALDRIDASELVESSWLRFEPTPDGVSVVLHVKEAPPNRAEVALGYSEWEKARGAIRLRNQNVMGFGEQLELLLAASDAESLARLSLGGDRLFVAGFGYRLAAYGQREKPRFFTSEGDEINRASFDRGGGELSLRSSLVRWGFVEAGARFGSVETHARAGLDLLESSDRVRALFGRLQIDTLDDLAWPEHGRRLAVFGEWNLRRLGADRRYWRAEAEGQSARAIGGRLVAEVHGLAFLSGGDLPVYERCRLGGTTLPAYHHEELKGRQALAASLTLRYRAAGQLRVIARGGAGNVFARTRDVSLKGLRWGGSVGFYHPSPIGPVSFEIGLRERGQGLTTLSIGWN